MSEPSIAQPGVQVFDLLERLSFSDQGPQAQLLSESGGTRLVGLTLRAGREKKEHHSPYQLVVYVVEGDLIFTANGQPFSLHAGMALQLGAQIPHSLRAATDTRLLLILTPSPVSSRSEGQD